MSSTKDGIEKSSVLLEDQVDIKDASSVDNGEKASYSVDINDPDSELLQPSRRLVAEKKLVRMLDMRLLPTIVLIFILNYIDVSTCHWIHASLV